MTDNKRISSLVITRHPGESVLIGDNIRVVFVGMNRQHNENSNQISIRIEAPRDIKIVRSELEKNGR